MTKLSKAEACALLRVSDSTMTRRMRKGVYKFTRTGEGQYAEVQFTYEGLGLVEPLPGVEVVPEPQPTPERMPAVKAQTVPTLQESGGLPITEDSLGNPVHGPATKYSLLGPHPPIERTPTPGPFDHMDPALLPQTNYGADDLPIFDAASDNHPINAALIAQGKMQPMPTKPRHPNRYRNEILQLLCDVRRGQSR
jgi:hypothetical protein